MIKFRLLRSKTGKDTRYWQWPARFTYPGRYDDTGITSRLLQYAECTGNGRLNVFDVGTSEGVAVSDMQHHLKKFRIQIRIVGIDSSNKVKKRAEKNLDKFILGNIFEIPTSPEFDVVICSKMILHADAEIKSKVIEKCSEFLKTNGAMITDADTCNCQKPHSFKSKLVEGFTLLSNLKKGIVYFCRVWKQIQLENTITKIYLIIGPEDVKKYSSEIIDVWDKYSESEKKQIKRRTVWKHRFSRIASGPRRKRSTKFIIKYNSGYDENVLNHRRFWKKLSFKA